MTTPADIIPPDMPTDPVEVRDLGGDLDALAEIEARLNELDRRIDTEKADLDALEQEADELRLLIEAARSEEPPPPPPPPPPLPGGRWWMKRGGPSLCNRPFRAGGFAFFENDIRQYDRFMGAMPEILGGNCRTYGNGSRADTWAKVQAQTAFDQHPQTRAAFLGQFGLSRQDIWKGLMLTTLPMGAPMEEFIAAANGKRNDNWKRMGAAARKVHLKNSCPLDMSIYRTNWEMNKRTAFAVGSGKFPNYRLAGGTVAQYNAMMVHFYNSFGDGYEEFPILDFSPAYEHGPGVPHDPYDEYLKAGVYRLCGTSFHPNDQRTSNRTAAWQLVFADKTKFYTPMVAIKAARAYAIPVAFLEHSCPPDPKLLSRANQWLSFSYTQFGKECNRLENNVAFTMALGGGMVTPGRMKNLPPPAPKHYDSAVYEHQQWFGKKRETVPM